MLSLRTHRLSFGYSSAVSLLSDVDLHLSTGWTGLVGPNGAGKTTLLRLFTGELTPDSGHVSLDPPRATIAVCPQTVQAMEPGILAFARADDASAHRMRGELDLNPHDLARWETLSPGERKRWQIGSALVADPHVLLLDEPTNHLDEGARTLLIEALRRFRGIGVVISHDRTLLAELTTSTLRVDRGSARLWRGAYDAASRDWRAEEEARVESRKRLEHEEQALARQLADARRNRASVEANLSVRKRMKNKHDHDSRGMGAQNRVGWAESNAGKKVGILRRKLEHAAEQTSSIIVDKPVGRSIFIDYVRSPSPWLFTVDAPCIRAGDTQVLGPVHLMVEREDRIRIEGPNGSGKTTLLNAMLSGARIPMAKVLYLPQDLGAGDERALLREVRLLPRDERGRVLSMVAALGVDPDRLLGSEHPSPGEARKLMIALGLGRHVWALVLDEPTNHMDLPSIERLEQALAEYPGALLLVSHDDRLAGRLTSTPWRIEGGAVQVASQMHGLSARALWSQAEPHCSR